MNEHTHEVGDTVIFSGRCKSYWKKIKPFKTKGIVKSKRWCFYDNGCHVTYDVDVDGVIFTDVPDYKLLYDGEIQEIVKTLGILVVAFIFEAVLQSFTK